MAIKDILKNCWDVLWKKEMLFIGVVRPAFKVQNFSVPVFKGPFDKFYSQQVHNGRITGFKKFHLSPKRIAYSQRKFKVRKGTEPIYGYSHLDDSVSAGTKGQLRDDLLPIIALDDNSISSKLILASFFDLHGTIPHLVERNNLHFQKKELNIQCNIPQFLPSSEPAPGPSFNALIGLVQGLQTATATYKIELLNFVYVDNDYFYLHGSKWRTRDIIAVINNSLAGKNFQPDPLVSGLLAFFRYYFTSGSLSRQVIQKFDVSLQILDDRPEIVEPTQNLSVPDFQLFPVLLDYSMLDISRDNSDACTFDNPTLDAIQAVISMGKSILKNKDSAQYHQNFSNAAALNV